MYRLPQQAEEEGAKKASAASFSRTIGRAKPVVYHITERAPKPGSSDWHRVVAVFVTGQTWQFKGWPHKARAHPMCPSPCHQRTRSSAVFERNMMVLPIPCAAALYMPLPSMCVFTHAIIRLSIEAAMHRDALPTNRN